MNLHLDDARRWTSQPELAVQCYWLLNQSMYRYSQCGRRSQTVSSLTHHSAVTLLQASHAAAWDHRLQSIDHWTQCYRCLVKKATICSSLRLPADHKKQISDVDRGSCHASPSAHSGEICCPMIITGFLTCQGLEMHNRPNEAAKHVMLSVLLTATATAAPDHHLTKATAPTTIVTADCYVGTRGCSRQCIDQKCVH